MALPITVFIVDDDESSQRAMSRLMRAAHFQPVCANSVKELMAKQLPSHEAVIIADVTATRQYAETLPKQLHESGRSLPVIYLTDCDTEHTRKEARRVGAAGYFRKPVDEQALVDAITFAVRHSTAELSVSEI